MFLITPFRLELSVRRNICIHTVTFYLIEPRRRVHLSSQVSQESGTVIMDTSMTASMAAKKTTTGVLFTLEGVDILLQNQTEVL